MILKSLTSHRLFPNFAPSIAQLPVVDHLNHIIHVILTATARWRGRIQYNIIYSESNIIYRNTDYTRGCLGQLVLSILLHLHWMQNSLPVAVRAIAWWRQSADRLSVGDDQKVRVWDIAHKRIHQVIEDELERWGQITCIQSFPPMTPSALGLEGGSSWSIKKPKRWYVGMSKGYQKSTYNETGSI